MMKYAYITLATTRKYLEGAKYLYFSFLKTKSIYPFFIMVWPETDISGYEDLPIKVVPKIWPIKDTDYLTLKGDYRELHSFNKFNVFLFENYDYIMFIDSDCIIKNNLDKYFDFCKPVEMNLLPYDKNYIKKKRFKVAEKTLVHCLHASYFLAKPNTNTYLTILENLNGPCDDENLLYDLWVSGKIKINFLKENQNPFYGKQALLHPTSMFDSRDIKKDKYWQTKEGMDFYNKVINGENIENLPW